MLRSRLKWLVRETTPGRYVSRAAVRAYGEIPVEAWPSWVGTLTGIKLPRRTRPLPARSCETGANINIIFELVAATRNVAGAVAECGVFQAATLIPTAIYVKQHRHNTPVLGFDSFRGFGHLAAEEAQGRTALPDTERSGFSDTSLRAVERKLAAFGIADKVRLFEGYFDESLPQAAEYTFSFVHLDCDLYRSYKTCLAFFYHRLAPGGIILLDEYNDPSWPGCNRAVDEFLKASDAEFHEIVRDNCVKYYLRKP